MSEGGRKGWKKRAGRKGREERAPNRKRGKTRRELENPRRDIIAKKLYIG